MCESREDCEQVREFSISIENCVKCVKDSNIWWSMQNKHSYTIWTLKGKFTSNSQLLQSKPLFDCLFTEIVFLIKFHQMLIWIEWDLFHCTLEEKLFHMNSSLFFEFLSYIQLPTFAVKTHFQLTFHWVSIFDQISSNTHLNWMGLVSLCSRREILSYELKFIFLSFCRNFIVHVWIFHAWIWSCSTHVHQVWEFEKLWLTLGLQIKFKTHPYA